MVITDRIADRDSLTENTGQLQFTILPNSLTTESSKKSQLLKQQSTGCGKKQPYKIYSSFLSKRLEFNSEICIHAYMCTSSYNQLTAFQCYQHYCVVTLGYNLPHNI